MMKRYFTPNSTVRNNIQRYAAAGAKNDVVIYPCVIRRVYRNLKADIYIPYTSTVMESLPIIFDSFSEEQGDITMPEENSLSLYISSSDGRRYVFGGASLSENYIVRNILPGEAERYVKNSSQKQDIAGNYIFSSRLCSTEIFGKDGIKQSYSEGMYQENKFFEEFSTTILTENGTSRFIKIQKIYSKSNSQPSYNGNDISEEIQQVVIQRNEDIKNKVLDYLVGIQNLKENFSEDGMKAFIEDIHQNYRYQRKLCMVIEEGSAVNKNVIDRIDTERLTKQDLAYAADGTPIIYRVRTFDEEENMTSCYSISESGYVDFWEKTQEVILSHDLDDYPTITLLQADLIEHHLKPLDFETTYMGKDTVKVAIKSKYGVVQTVVNQGFGQYELILENGRKIYANLGYSAKKMTEMVRQITSTQ